MQEKIIYEDIHEDIIELLDEILQYYEENNWLVVKKYILKYINPELRKLFSTRHVKTKKHILNKFEKQIIIFCKHNYDIELVLQKEDEHNE